MESNSWAVWDLCRPDIYGCVAIFCSHGPQLGCPSHQYVTIYLLLKILLAIRLSSRCLSPLAQHVLKTPVAYAVMSWVRVY